MSETKKLPKILERKEKINEFIDLIHALTEEFDFNLFRIHEFHNTNSYSFKLWFKQKRRHKKEEIIN